MDDLDAIVALDRATDTAPHWPRSSYAQALPANAMSELGAVSSPSRCIFVANTLAENQSPGTTLLLGFAVCILEPAPAPGVSSTAAIEQGSITRSAELESIVVASAARRGGIGRRLCTAVLDWCHSHGATAITLEVRAGNAAALALYHRLGFAQVGRRPRYYRLPEEDAIVLQLALGTGATLD